jgi:hypothetical protein
LDARRLRLFAFDVFFLGTAMEVGFLVLQDVERRPSRIGWCDAVPAVALVAVGSASRAQTLTVLSAEGYQRQFQQDSVARQWLKVDLVAVQRIRLLEVAVLFEQLPHAGPDLSLGWPEAPPTIPHPRSGHGAGGDDAAVHHLNHDVDLDFGSRGNVASGDLEAADRPSPLLTDPPVVAASERGEGNDKRTGGHRLSLRS